jgi:hypothetical protein
MPANEIFVQRLPNMHSKVQYFRSVIPDLPIALCKNCHHFFHEEDFEFHVLQQKTCPFCRIIVDTSEPEPE